MKKAFILSFFLFQLLVANAQIQYRQTGSGLQFNILKDEAGKTAQVGQLVSMHLMIQDVNGNDIKNTYKDGKPLMFPVKLSAFEGDIYEAVGLLSKGDSAIFKVLADSMFIKVFRKPLPENIPSGSFLDMNIKVFDVWDQQQKLEELKAKLETEISPQENERRTAEDAKIKAYCKANGYEMQQTKTGVYYTYFSKGNGEKVSKDGDVVILNFTGKLLNDSQFETTYNAENIGRPISFTLGKEEVIDGWDDVLKGKKEGDKIFAIVPSHLAFGSHAKGNIIPANSVLVFNLDVMGVR